jgi:hypothetical protein
MTKKQSRLLQNATTDPLHKEFLMKKSPNIYVDFSQHHPSFLGVLGLTLQLPKLTLMKKTAFVALLALSCCFSSTFGANRYWISSLAGNWNNSANWSAASGGAGGATVPGAGDVAIFDGAGGRNGNCTLDLAPTVGGITVNGYTGTINIAGFTLTTTGTNLFTTGTLQNTGAAASVAINSAGTTTFNGTTFNADITGSSGAVFFSGSVFNNPVSITKSGASTDAGSGNNTFGSSLSITVAGTGALRMSNVTRDIYNGPVSLTVSSTGTISMAYTGANNQFNDNISITYNTATAIGFGANGGTSILAAGKTFVSITSGAAGCGNLNLVRFTQNGATAQTISLGGNGTSTLTIGPSSTFNGSLAASAPNIILNTSTFQGATTITKLVSGASSDNIRGGNVFNGTFTANNQCANDMYFGSTVGDAGDTWNAPATFNSTGGGRIRVAAATSGTLFTNTATFNVTALADVQSRIQICRFATGQATFNGAVVLNNAGNSSDIQISYDAGSSTTFNGPVTVISNTNTTAGSFYIGYDGDVLINNNINFNSLCGDNIQVAANNGTATLGNGFSMSIGGSGFSLGVLTFKNFTQTGATAQSLTLTGTARLTFGPAVTFNGNVSFVSPQIYLNGGTYNGTAYFEKSGATDNYSAGGNTFGGATTLTNTGSGAFILGNGTSDQFLSTATFNNTGNYRMYFAYSHSGQTTSFSGDVVLNTNKAGGADGWSFLAAEGVNTNFVINGNLTINCNGSLQSNHRFLNGSGSTGTYNGTVTVNLANTHPSTVIQMGTAGTSSFTNNIVVTNSGGASGVSFNVNATSSSTLSAGNTISIGGAGFAGGTLNLPRFTQVGATSQTLNSFSGTAILTIGPNSAFGGDVTFVAPQLFLNGCTYSGTAYIEKTGATGNAGTGGNIFNAATTLVNSGTGYLLTANNNPDIFNADLTVNNTGSSIIYLAHNVPGTQFNGNVSVSQPNPGTGVYFSNNATGSSVMAATKTISIGALGFSSSDLGLYRFTQNGSAPVNLTLTGNARILLGPSTTLGGDATIVAPQVLLNGTIYNGAAYLEKNGASNNAGTGGNTFNGVTTLVNSGSAYLLTGNTNPDTFNGDLTLTNTGASLIYVAHNVPGTQFNGNIAVNCSGGTGIYFSNNATGASTLGSSKTITVGATGFNTGELRLQRFTQLGATDQNLTFTGNALLTLGPTSTFNGNVNFVAPQVLLNGTTYNGTVYIEKNGAINNLGNGGNVFNTSTTLVDSGSGYLATANSAADIFNGDLTVTNTGSNVVYLSNNSAGNQFNGNIILNSTSGLGIYFSNSGGGTSSLANGKTISVGPSGFTFGELRLSRFTQVGNTAQSLTLTNIASLRIGPTSVFNGDVNFIAPQLYLDGATYNGIAYLEKNGATGNTGLGNNVFASTATIVNSGSNILRTFGNNLFNGATTLTCSGSNDLLLELINGSTYNGDVTMNNTGSSYVRAAYTGINAFNGNVVVNSTSGTGIFFCENTAGSATLANTKTISIGGSGFTFGTLSLPRFTQVGNTPQVLNLTNVSTLTVGPSSTFNGAVTFTTPAINLNGCTYNDFATITKTGSTNDVSAGGNVFNSVTSFTNSGTGSFLNGNTGLDAFNGDLTLTNSGTSLIYMSYTTSGTVFNGNIIVNCTNGTGIYFGQNGGASTLASGKTISLGGSGFSIGELRLYRFTQAGATPQNLNLTGIASLRLGNASVFNGDANFQSPQLYLDGVTFNGLATLTKSGATNNTGAGGNTFASTTVITNNGSGVLRTNGNNTFNGTTTIVNNGSADVLFELASGSTYNGDVTFTNTGPSYVRVAYTGGSSFNGNIIVNSTGGTGVYFCENAAGTATLAAGKTISVGGSGFTVGELRLQRFTQLGGTAQSLTLTGNSIFRTGPTSSWNGVVTVNSPQLFLDGATFNGTASFTKTGTTTDASVGGNTFNASATFTNSNIGVFRLASTTGDTFNSTSTYIQTSGTIQPTYSAGSTYAGDIITSGATAITFGTGSASGVMTFSGNAVQTISKLSGASPIFNRIVMSKSGGNVALSTDINIGVSATFTTGVINTTSTNVINFVNTSTTSGASNASYVDGPVRKTGNQAFTFPVGTAGIYRPIAISAPSVNTHAFTAQFFRAAQAFGGVPTYSAPLLTVSSCEYWVLDRTIGASNVFVTLSWNSPDCSGPYVTNLATLQVARWNLTNWVSHGNGSTTGNATSGTITSSAAVTSFSPFALASTSLANPLPIELSYFTATSLENTVQLDWATESEQNNDFFTVEKSVDGATYETVNTVKGSGTTTKLSLYSLVDEKPFPGISYYRLTQTDVDKATKIVSLAVVHRAGDSNTFSVYPNHASPTDVVHSNFSGPVVIVNMMGQSVLEYSNGSQMNVSTLNAGVYIVKTSTGLAQRLVIK